MAFDKDKLGNKPSGTSNKANGGPRAERVFMEVTNYETPSDGFHWAVGHTLQNPDVKVRVRLNTVDERLVDQPSKSADQIKGQYFTNENHRDSIADKAKANIRLLSFDDARFLGKNDAGESTFRAHWPKTMSTEPEAEFMVGIGHIKLKPEGNGKKAQAHVEMLRGSALLDASNVDSALMSGLSIKDDQNRARDPFVIMRVAHEGKIVSSARIYPETEPVARFDQQTGQNKEVNIKVDAKETLDKLFSGENQGSEFANKQADIVRAAVAGLKGESMPVLVSTDEKLVAWCKNLHEGVVEGAVQIELDAFEKIDFGADSRKTYLKDAESKSHLSNYTISEPVDDRHVRETAGYTNTVVAFMRHEDGEPYAVFASPERMYPKMTKWVDIPLNPMPDQKLTAAAEKRAEGDDYSPM